MEYAIFIWDGCPIKSRRNHLAHVSYTFILLQLNNKNAHGEQKHIFSNLLDRNTRVKMCKLYLVKTNEYLKKFYPHDQVIHIAS